MPATRSIPQGYLTVNDDCHAPDNYHNIITPEQRLLWSILERGVSDAIGLTGAGPDSHSLQREAYTWIIYPRHLIEFQDFSFEGICEHLDLNPTVIRKFIIVQLAKPRSELPTRARRINILNSYKPRATCLL